MMLSALCALGKIACTSTRHWPASTGRAGLNYFVRHQLLLLRFFDHGFGRRMSIGLISTALPSLSVQLALQPTPKLVMRKPSLLR